MTPREHWCVVRHLRAPIWWDGSEFKDGATGRALAPDDPRITEHAGPAVMSWAQRECTYAGLDVERLSLHFGALRRIEALPEWARRERVLEVAQRFGAIAH